MERAAVERTLALIKPDGVARGLIGEIIKRIEAKGLRIVALKMLRLEKDEAEEFYSVHRSRPFYASLTSYMASGMIIAMVLEGKGAVQEFRELIGSTDPKKAAPGTIRADFGTSIEENTVHGSDSPESAASEISFMFSRMEISE